MAVELNKISRDNLTTKVYDNLKRAIMSGRFQPGERLAIRPLAEKMGVSITPVREALLKLVSYGALEMEPAHPIIVPVLNKDLYLENRTIRIVNEGLAAAEAAKKIKKTEFENLLKINEEMRAAGREGRPDESIALNYSFHIDLCTIAGMPSLLEIIEILWLKIGPSLNILRSTDPGKAAEFKPSYHKDILQALEERDSRAAREAMEKDIIHGGAQMLAYFENQDL